MTFLFPILSNLFLYQFSAKKNATISVSLYLPQWNKNGALLANHCHTNMLLLFSANCRTRQIFLLTIHLWLEIAIMSIRLVHIILLVNIHVGQAIYYFANVSFTFTKKWIYVYRRKQSTDYYYADIQLTIKNEFLNLPLQVLVGCGI